MRAYTRTVPTRAYQEKAGATQSKAPPSSRRRPPSWMEQRKREAWGRFWSQVNKGAMSR